jgi:hypothetical protein
VKNPLRQVEVFTGCEDHIEAAFTRPGLCDFHIRMYAGHIKRLRGDPEPGGAYAPALPNFVRLKPKSETYHRVDIAHSMGGS